MIINSTIQLPDADVSRELFSFAIIKPDVSQKHLGNILQMIQDNDYKIHLIKRVKFSLEQAKYLYQPHKDQIYFDDLCDFMTIGTSYCLLLEKTRCIKDLRKLAGPSNYYNFRNTYANTIRGIFGEDIRRNAFHSSDSLESFKREVKLLS